MQNNNNNGSMTPYNTNVYKDKGTLIGDESVTVNQYGQFLVATPPLSERLRAEIINQASIDDCLKTLPLLTVDTVVMYAAQKKKSISSNTALQFLEDNVKKGNLIEQHDERGQQYFVRTGLFNRLHPISKINRDAIASANELKEKGFAD